MIRSPTTPQSLSLLSAPRRTLWGSSSTRCVIFGGVTLLLIWSVVTTSLSLLSTGYLFYLHSHVILLILKCRYAAPLFAKPTATLPRPPSTKPAAKAFGSSLHASAGDFTPPPSTSDSPASALLSRLAPSSISASAHSEPRAPSTPSPQRTRAESKDPADVDSLSSSSPISLLDTPAPASAAVPSVPAPSSQPPSSSTESIATLRNQRDEAEMANRLLKTQMKELNGEIQDLTERAKAAHAAAEKATEQVRVFQS